MRLRLLTNLSTKILLTITLVGLIAGYIVLSLNMEHQKEFFDTVYESDKKFLHDTLGKVKENALRTEYARHRKMMISLSTIFLTIQKNQDKKNDIRGMLNLILDGRGMIAIEILNSDNKIILMMYKKKW